VQFKEFENFMGVNIYTVIFRVMTPYNLVPTFLRSYPEDGDSRFKAG
jgi:hypothetical protein